MTKILKSFSLPRTLCCTELSGKRILVTGIYFIKIFSLETYEELQDIPSNDVNKDSLITNNEEYIFVATNVGIKQYSLLDFSFVKVYGNLTFESHLIYLK